MNITAALANLTQQVDALTAAHTAAPPVNPARLDAALTALCATYACEGADGLRHALEQNPRLRPDQRDGLVRLATNLVERARRGDALSDRQAAIVGLARAGGR